LVNGGRVIHIRPLGLLTANRLHSVNLTTGLRDTTGQAMLARTFTFTTSAVAVADTVAPRLALVSPVNGASNVSTNSTVHARFDEPINLLTLALTPAQTTFESVFWSNNNREVTFARHQPYAPNTSTTESFAAATDYASNTVAAPNSTTFTTGTGPD